MMNDAVASSVTDAVVLRASITAGADNRYAVHFAPANGTARIADREYLLFIVHYYARVLYELGRDRSVRNLPALVDAVATPSKAWDPDVFHLVGVRGGVDPVVLEPVGTINVALRTAGYRRHEIDGEISLRGRPLAYSVLAAIEAALPRVGGDTVSMILTALANMNVSYALTHDYSDPRSRYEVPTIACMAAAFV